MVDQRSPGNVVQLFALEHDRLITVLDTLSNDEWALPTPCPGWNVRDLVSHLVNDSLGILSRDRDGYDGTPGPETRDEGEFVRWLDQYMIEWVHATRGLSPRVLVDLLSWSAPLITAHFSRQLPTATAHVEWAGEREVPVWLNQVREQSEFWIHRQQILESLGQSADLRSDVLAPVLSGLRWAYPYRLGTLTKPEGDCVVIAITGSVDVTWVLVSSGTDWNFRDHPGRVIATLAVTTDDAWRLLTNNLSRDRLLDLRVSGDPEVVRILLATRAIIGSVKPQ